MSRVCGGWMGGGVMGSREWGVRNWVNSRSAEFGASDHACPGGECGESRSIQPNQGLPDDRILLRQGFLRPESHGGQAGGQASNIAEAPIQGYTSLQQKNFEDLIFSLSAEGSGPSR